MGTTPYADLKIDFEQRMSAGVEFDTLELLTHNLLRKIEAEFGSLFQKSVSSEENFLHII